MTKTNLTKQLDKLQIQDGGQNGCQIAPNGYIFCLLLTLEL